MKVGLNALGGAKSQAAVLLILAFLAGAVAGGATERLVIRRLRELRGPMGRGPGGMMGAARGGMGGFMRRGDRGPGGPDGAGGLGGPGGRGGLGGVYGSLDLSDAQRAKVEEIVTKRRARVDSVMKSAGDIMRAAMDSTRAEIDGVLTPAQRTKADSLRANRRGGMRGMRGGGGPGGDSASGRMGPPRDR